MMRPALEPVPLTAVQRLAKIIEQCGTLEADYLDRPCHTLEVEYKGRVHSLGAFHDGTVLVASDVGTYACGPFDAVFFLRQLEPVSA